MELIFSNPIVAALIALGLLAACFGAILGFAAIKFKVEGDPIVDQIDAILPQTQCGQCGYPGCRPYAQAISEGDAIPAPELDEEHGQESEVKKVAYIREDECIGCTKCIQACPVDAILGAAKHMHTVIASECTGCDLCVEPCPVDCIDMLPVESGIPEWKWDLPNSGNIIATDRNHSEDGDKKSGEAA